MSAVNDSQLITADCSIYSTVKTLFLWCFAVKVLLLLPLCLVVLYIGVQQRLRRPSHQPCVHADFFTFHMVALELAGIVSLLLHVGGFYGRSEAVVILGLVLSSVNVPGEVLVLALACVDRYMAVVRPMTYLQLQRGNGITVRNISATVVWIVSFMFVGLTHLHHPKLPVVEFLCLLTTSLLVVSFCSGAVLHVLIHPGPGASPGDRNKVDRSKLRAFRIVVTVMSVQLFWLLGLLTCMSAQKVELLSREKRCLVSAAVSWFNIPCSLVLPALFLQKNRSSRVQQ